MTVDVDPPFSSSQNFIIIKGVTYLLDLFEEYAIKATFFVPSIVAKNFPDVIKEVARKGHEIACHGLEHRPEEGTLGVNKQIYMIKTATKVIESITGIKPVGFRAPLFKANNNCWIALQKNNYIYDSSLIGFPHVGKRRICLQMKPLRVRIHNSTAEHPKSSLFELPVSTNPLLPFPLGGGWFRIFGLEWAKIGIKMNFLSQTPVVFYIHPKDIVEVRTPGLFWYNYRNTANGLRMLSKIINYVKKCKAEFLRAYDLIELFKK